MPEEPAAASDLYGLPLDEFTRSRDRLVKKLKEDERKEEAEAVGKLRKPTIDAWALNQVARTRPDLIALLLDSHAALREARDVEAMRAASESRTGVLGQIVAAASTALSEGGHSAGPTAKDRISRTLLASAGDAGTEELLRSGTLEKTGEIGSEWSGLSVPPAPRPPEPEEDPEREDELERLAARLEELEGHLGDLKTKAQQAKTELERARRESEQAEARVRKAEKEVRKAEDELKAARRH